MFFILFFVVVASGAIFKNYQPYYLNICFLIQNFWVLEMAYIERVLIALALNDRFFIVLLFVDICARICLRSGHLLMNLFSW